MLKIAKAIGANTDLLTAQAFIYRSSLAVLLSGEGDDVFIKLRQVGLDLEEEFFGLEDPYATRIPAVVEKISEKLGDITNLQILLGFWQGDVLYLFSTGSHEAFLQREGKISELLPEGSKGQLISGFMKNEDRVLLSTDSESTELIDRSVDSFEEEMGIYLLKQEAQAPIAAILAENIVEETMKEPIEEPAPVIAVGHGRLTALLKKELMEKFKAFMSRLAAKQEEESFSNPFYQAPIKQSFSLNKKVKIALVSGLAAVIAAGFIWNFVSSNNTKREADFDKAYSGAKDAYSKAQSLKDSDQQGAKQSLDEAKKKLSDALKIKPKEQKALDFQKEIDSGSNGILKVMEIRDWPLFLSLDLVRQGLSSKRMSFSLGKMLFLDDKQKTLVVIDSAKKNNQILAGQLQLGDAVFASLNGNSAFVYSKDKGIMKADLVTTKITNPVKPDPDWGNISDIFGFSGNVYLLDSVKSQVWKYVPVAAGYSDRFPYIKSKQDLAGAKKLNIDYSVWILKDGQIFKFTAGAGDFFSVGGLDKPIGEISSFFVPEDEDSIYILDKPNSRILVLKKSGQYFSQITGDKFKTADDFAIDTESKKMFLLENNNIYQIDLKQ